MISELKKPDMSLGELKVVDDGDLGISIRRKNDNSLVCYFNSMGVSTLKEWLKDK